MKPVPPGWGEDPLTSYLDGCRHNQFATFYNMQKRIESVIEVDRLLMSLVSGATDPAPVFPMTFLLRSHSALRASIGSIMSGQLFEAHTTLRLALEHAGYGFYIGSDVERWKLWMSRTDGPDARPAVRKEFGHTSISRFIMQAAPELGRRYEALYDRLIDFGAHPNEQAFSLSSRIVRAPEKIQLDAIYLHNDERKFEMGLKTAGVVALWTLHAGQNIYPQRCASLGIGERLPALEDLF